MVALGASFVAVSRIRLEPMSGLTDACERLLSSADVTAAAVLGLVVLGAVVVVRILMTMARLAHRSRKAVSALPVCSTVPGALIVDADAVNAFCAGLLRPRVYVTRGAVNALENEELAAVIAHEAHHAARRDPLRIVIARAGADGLFFLPVLRRIAQRYADLAELDADEAAVCATGGSTALAGALLTFDERTGPNGGGVTRERVQSLCGTRSKPRISPSAVALTVVSLGATLALTVIAARLAIGTSVVTPAMAFHGFALLTVLVAPAGLPALARARRRSRAARMCAP